MRSSYAPEGNHVEAVIRAAGRRMLLVVMVEQAAIALSLVLGGCILLLLLGTQLLDWYWLALLGAVGAGVAAARVRARARPLGPYRVAQLVDQRLQLSDSLSTAWFLTSQARRDAVARFQIAHAEKIARSIRPARAFPFSGSRTWSVAGALAAVAFGLFAVRYLVTSSLSLQQALIPIQLGPMVGTFEQRVSGWKAELAGAADGDARREPQRAARSEKGEETNRASTSKEAQPGNSPSADAAGAATAQNGDSQADSTKAAEGKPTGQPAGREAMEQPNGNGSGARESAEAKEHGGEQGRAAQPSSAGVLDKMRDALSSLMAKMRANAGSERTAREGERSEAERQASEQTALERKQDGSQQSAGREQAGEQQKTEGQAQGQTTEQAQAPQGRSSEGADRKGSDSQSGAGHQDGDKAVREAEQQQAMGKLAEIIGKRSANLTGDMTVETRAGKQRLETEYSSRLGRHSDVGGEINRDEIPVEYQQYVRDYMDAVRKQQQRSQ